MNLRMRQSGMTGIGWIIVLGLIAFFAVLVLRLAPIYLEYAQVASAVDSLEREPLITKKPPGQIQKLLLRRFDVNDVKRVNASNIKLQRSGGVLTITVAYEARVHLLGNIDAVAVFHKSLELVSH